MLERLEEMEKKVALDIVKKANIYDIAIFTDLKIVEDMILNSKNVTLDKDMIKSIENMDNDLEDILLKAQVSML